MIAENASYAQFFVDNNLLVKLDLPSTFSIYLRPPVYLLKCKNDAYPNVTSIFANFFLSDNIKLQTKWNDEVRDQVTLDITAAFYEYCHFRSLATNSTPTLSFNNNVNEQNVSVESRFNSLSNNETCRSGVYKFPQHYIVYRTPRFLS